MQAVSLYSAPGENYSKHIEECLDKFKVIFPVFRSSAERIFQKNGNGLEPHFESMIKFHDLGKLTERWQKNLGKKHLPSHSTLGAAYLWKTLKTLPEGIREPLSFAVAIHHTDRGLLGDNIERPDVEAILDNIVNYDGKIIWDKETDKLNNDLFPDEARNLTIDDLKEMARGLRVWAKGCAILEQHQRRIQASFAHHILKLCDVSAASGRKEYQKQNNQDYYGGWLMAVEICNYVKKL